MSNPNFPSQAQNDSQYTKLRAVATTVTTNTTAAINTHLTVDATTGLVTVTLPTGASGGTTLSIEKVDTSANFVAMTGTIRGATTTLYLYSQYEAQTFIASSSGSWRPVADQKSWSFLNTTYAPKAAQNTVSDISASVDTNAPTNWSSSSVLVIPIATMLAATGNTTIYEPSIINVSSLSGMPGNYLAYWSTNHDSGAGGIGMAYASSPLGPWTTQTGAVYVDTVSGTQTETPWVILNPSGTGLIMYYQNSQVTTGSPNGNQTTLYATSTDGINWTRGGIALYGDTFLRPGDGHTGYLKCHRVGDLLVGYSLYGGTNFSRTAVWFSRDGIHWAFGKYFFGMGDITGDITLKVKFRPLLFDWRGHRWGAVAIASPSSGGASSSTSQNYVARIRDDMLGFAEFPQVSNFIPSSIVNYNNVLYGFAVSSSGLYYKTIGA